MDTGKTNRILPLRFDGCGRPAWIAAVGLVAISVCDAFTTSHILAHGGWEANPIMAWLIGRIGEWALVLKVLATTLVALWIVGRWGDRLATAAAILALLVCGIPVGLNLYHIAGGNI